MNIGMLILTALYFMLPAYFANMAPVMVRNIPLLEQLSKRGICIESC